MSDDNPSKVGDEKDTEDDAPSDEERSEESTDEPIEKSPTAENEGSPAKESPGPKGDRGAEQSTNMTRHVVAGCIVAASVVAAGLALSTSPDVPRARASTEGGGETVDPLEALRPQLVTKRRAPQFELRDRHGKAHSLATFAGRPVILNFWSADCPPCVEEMPSLARLDAVARESGEFTVVTVTVDERWEQVERLFPGGTKLLVLFDPERNVVTKAFGTERFPETFLIDAEGFVRARFDGQRNWASTQVLRVIAGLRSGASKRMPHGPGGPGAGMPRGPGGPGAGMPHGPGGPGAGMPHGPGGPGTRTIPGRGDSVEGSTASDGGGGRSDSGA